MALTFVVKLEAMRFHARIGILPHEAELAQSVEVDLSAWVSRDEKAHGSEGVLDYRVMYDIVSGVIAKGHILYLEDLVAQIAEQALGHAGVERVKVSARKPNVALAGPLAYAQETIERARDG
jgi:dihydroneopterin aldolase